MSKGKNIWDDVLWFRNRGNFDIDFFDLLQPSRAVSSNRRYKSGLFTSEKCGRDIQYESGIELEFVKSLEADKRVRFYWDQPVRIGFWHGRRKLNYTPDFGIYLATGEFVIAEVKDLPGMLDHRVQAKAEALMEFCSGHGFGMLLTDGRRSPGSLQKGKVNRKLEKELLAALDVNALRKQQCREIMQRCGAVPAELYKAIIRHNLKFRPFPMKLQRGNRNNVFRQVFFEKKKYDELAEERFSTLFGTKLADVRE